MHTLWKKTMLVVVMVAIVVSGTFAAMTSSKNVTLTVAGPSAEAKLEGAYTVKIPMLQGEGPLFEGNNLKLKGLVSLSPVAASMSVDAVLTPIAVAEVSLGGTVGTGWDFGLLDVEGLRLGSGPVGTSLVSDQLGGVCYKGKAGLTLQFDTAAIIPGDWTSVVMQVHQDVDYRGYTGADADQAWEFETGGALENGFNYQGEYIIGYQMPLMLDTVALMFDQYVYHLFSDDAHPFLCDLSLIGNIAVTDSLNVTVVTQFTNFKKASDTREFTQEDFHFKRIACMASYSF